MPNTEQNAKHTILSSAIGENDLVTCNIVTPLEDLTSPINPSITLLTPSDCDKLIHDKMYGFGYVANLDTYELQYATDALLEKIQRSRADFGRKCYEVIFNFSEPCSFCAKEILKTQPSHKRYRHNYQIGKHFAIIDHGHKENGINYLIHTTFDVSDEIKSIFDFKHLASARDAIIACATILFHEQNPNTAIPKLLEILCNHYGAESAALFERDYVENISKCAYHFALEESPKKHECFEYSFSLTKYTKWLDLLDNAPYYFTDSDAPAELVDFFPIKEGPCALKNNRNVLFVPLEIEGIVIGAINLTNLTANVNEFEPVTTIAAFITNMLTLKYSEKNLENTIRLLEERNNLNHAILDCAKTLIYEDGNISLAIGNLLKIITDYFDADASLIFKRKDDSNILFPKYEYFNLPKHKGVQIPEISYEVLYSWYQVFKDASEEVAFSDKDDPKRLLINADTFEYKHLEKRHNQSFMIAPLKEYNRIRSFIWVENPKKNAKGVALLVTVANFIVNHIVKDELLKKLEFLSFTDKLTGVYNRNFYVSYIEQVQHNTHNNLGIVYADVNGLKMANDNFGHEYGDILLQWSAQFLKDKLKGLVFRIGGDEFVCFVEKIPEDYFNTLVEAMKEELAKYRNTPFSLGAAWLNDSANLHEYISKTDKLMYDDKQQYYKRNREDSRPVKTLIKDLHNTLKEFEKALK